jgi:hypothetical protein
MNVYDHVVASHRRILALIGELERALATSRPIRAAAFAALEEELLVHAESEQEIFYRTLLYAEVDAGEVARGIDAHAAILAALASLQVLPMQDRRWAAKLRSLRRLFEAHVVTEEEALFEQARAHLSSWEEIVIAECMRDGFPDFEEDELAADACSGLTAQRNGLRLVH